MKVYGIINKTDLSEELYHVAQVVAADDYFQLIKSDTPSFGGVPEKYGPLYLTTDRGQLEKWLSSTSCYGSVLSPYYDGNKSDLRIIEKEI